MAPKILVVEDEVDVQGLIRNVLEREGFEAIIVGSGDEAIKEISSGKIFNLGIFDWMLPGVSGIDLCQKFKGKFPILMVTAREDAADVVRGLDAGADDYLVKPFSLPVLAARVRALLRRAELSEKNILELGNLKVDVKGVHVFCNDQEIKLTASEFKVLVLLLQNKGKVLSRSALLKLSHEENVHVVERVIDTQLYTLRKKLGPCGNIFETVRGIGYRVASA